MSPTPFGPSPMRITPQQTSGYLKDLVITKMWFIKTYKIFSIFIQLVLTSVIEFDDRPRECPAPSNFPHLEVKMNDLKGHWFEIERNGFPRENLINCAMFHFNSFKSPKGKNISIKVQATVFNLGTPHLPKKLK